MTITIAWALAIACGGDPTASSRVDATTPTLEGLRPSIPDGLLPDDVPPPEPIERGAPSPPAAPPGLAQQGTLRGPTLDPAAQAPVGPPMPSPTDEDPAIARLQLAAQQPAPKLVVLGLAQDAGVPQAGCDCARCQAAVDDPRTRPRVASVAVVLADGRVLLVDATPDLAWQLRDVARLRGERPDARGRRLVDGLLLTHGHVGHYLGLAQLGYEAAHADHVPVYGTAKMLDLLREHAPWSQLVQREEIELRTLAPGRRLALEGLTIVPVAVPHRDELTDTVGFRFEGPQRTALYVPDCDPWSRWDRSDREALLRGVDVALLDGTFYSGDELPGRDLTAIGHPLVVDTMDWLEPRHETLEVRFIHLNHSNPALTPDSEARREIERRGFAVAQRGDVIPL